MRLLTVFCLIMILGASCATAPATGPATPVSPAASPPAPGAQPPVSDVLPQLPEGVYYGSGRSPSLLTALKAAKVDAVRKYVQELLGPAKFSVYEEKLQKLIFSTDNPNQYVAADSYEALSKSKDAQTGDYILTIKVPVRREDLKQTLLANEIRWAGAPPSSAAISDPGTGTAPAAVPPAQDDTWGTVTPDEQKFIHRYIDTLVFLVYFDEKSPLDPSVLKLGVTRANSYLAGKNCDLVDLDQVEKIRDDQQKVWEQETGKDLGYVQWVARKLNAGVYVVIGADSRDDFENTLYGAQMNVRLKFFEPSTGELLGEMALSTPRVLSRTSAADAQMKALQQAVISLMPAGLDQVRAKLSKTLVRGIKYDLVVQKTSDSKLMAQFRRKLESKVKMINVVSSSPEESRYEVFYLGSGSELEDLVVKTAENIPGLEGLYQVLVQGRSLTFNSGL